MNSLTKKFIRFSGVLVVNANIIGYHTSSLYSPFKSTKAKANTEANDSFVVQEAVSIYNRGVYFGQMNVKGQRHGYGVLYGDDELYCGQWSEDNKNGLGTLAAFGVSVC